MAQVTLMSVMALSMTVLIGLIYSYETSLALYDFLTTNCSLPNDTVCLRNDSLAINLTREALDWLKKIPVNHFAVTSVYWLRDHLPASNRTLSAVHWFRQRVPLYNATSRGYSWTRNETIKLNHTLVELDRNLESLVRFINESGGYNVSLSDLEWLQNGNVTRNITTSLLVRTVEWFRQDFSLYNITVDTYRWFAMSTSSVYAIVTNLNLFNNLMPVLNKTVILIE